MVHGGFLYGLLFRESDVTIFRLRGTEGADRDDRAALVYEFSLATPSTCRCICYACI